MDLRERPRASGQTRAVARASALLVLGLLPGLVFSSCGDSGSDQVLAGSGPGQGAGLARQFAPEDDRPGGAPRDSTTAPDPRTGSWNQRLHELGQRYRALAVRHAGGQPRPAQIELSIHVRTVPTEPSRGATIELAALDADSARPPASNMKLVTTAAALVLFGAGQDFLTPLESSGVLEDGVLRGDLIVRASGDPIIRVDGDARVEERLDVLVRGAQQAGIRRVAGDLVLDEGSFQTPGPLPGWPDASQYWQEHCALAGGFTLNGGVLQARVLPGRPSAAASVSVHPRPHGLRRNYGVDTGTDRLDVRVGATASAVTVRGTIPASTPLYTPDFSHPDPVSLFGTVLMDRFERGGILFEGGIRRRRDVPAGNRIAALRSPLNDVLGPINADSRNSVADQLLLAIGNAVQGEGTSSAGAEAVGRALQILGIETDGFRLLDGSGLSRDNRVSARQLTGLIAGVLSQDPETARVYRDSLAIAGQTGTLEARMKGTAAEGRVYAKTGWIRGVSSLAGLCETLGGETLAFAILVNYPPSLGGLNTRVFKPMQDELVTQLVEDVR